jgi:hypothetical protein
MQGSYVGEHEADAERDRRDDEEEGARGNRVVDPAQIAEPVLPVSLPFCRSSSAIAIA